MYTNFMVANESGLTGNGPVAHRLLKARMNPNVLRPYVGEDGKSYYTRVQNGVPVAVPLNNDNAILTKEGWNFMDEVIGKAFRSRLGAVADVRRRGLEKTIPGGWGKTVHEYTKQTDPGSIRLSMDGLARANNDRPEYDWFGTPLPILSGRFGISARQQDVSVSAGADFDAAMGEAEARRLAEGVEQMYLGTAYDGFTFGQTITGNANTIHGLTTAPDANSKTLTAPTAAGWTPNTLIQEILAMRQQSQDDLCFGPWQSYCSIDWDPYLDEDYSAAKGDNTLRARIGLINKVSPPMTLDYLPSSFSFHLAQMTADQIRLLILMEPTVIQWEEQGGMDLQWMVLVGIIPEFRSDINGHMGLVLGTV